MLRFIRLLLVPLLVIAASTQAQVFQVRKSFDTLRTPASSMVPVGDGTFLGVTTGGGNAGAGGIFRLRADGTVSTLAMFSPSRGSGPYSRLVQGADGLFYGTAFADGNNFQGTLYRVSTGGAFEVLRHFNGTDGAFPDGPLVRSGNDLFGTTARGGPDDRGTFFRLNVLPDGTTTFTSLGAFTNSHGYYPHGALAEGFDGNFYGTTRNGGAVDVGTIFRVTRAGFITQLSEFDGTNGELPRGLIRRTDGNFLCVTQQGGFGAGGTLLRIATDGAQTVLSNFNNSVGAQPTGEWLAATDGSFWGVNETGGANGFGAVFRVVDNTITDRVALGASNGSTPRGGLAQTSTGELLGVAATGLANDSGAIFRISSSSPYVMSTVQEFGKNAGEFPSGQLVAGNDEKLYGVTTLGGANGLGTLFSYDPLSGATATVVQFDGTTNGANPKGPLLALPDGALIGVTAAGGTSGFGTVFRYTPGGALTTMAHFNSTLGREPNGGMVRDDAGNIYGTAYLGGATNRGTLWKLDAADTLSAVLSFVSTNGSRPRGSLLLSDGKIYGATETGGNNSRGTVWSLDLAAPGGPALTTLRHFASATDGAYPNGGLAVGPGGALYGTTVEGGATQGAFNNGYGTIFKIHPTNGFSVAVHLDATGPINPNAGFTIGPDGLFYGSSASGGSGNLGTIYRLDDTGAAPVITVLRGFNGTDGRQPVTGIFHTDQRWHGLAQDSIWRFTFSGKPAVITRAVENPQQTSAVLAATVLTSTLSSDASFEWGYDNTYGNTTPAELVTDPTEAVTVRYTLGGFDPHTTIFYRARATNSLGTTIGAGRSFTLPNTPPQAATDTVTGTAEQFQAGRLIAVMANDQDLDGDTLTIQSVSTPTFGTAVIEGTSIRYTSGANFQGADTFTYTLGDGWGGSVTATVNIATSSVFSSTYATAGKIGTATATPAPGETAGSILVKLGPPNLLPDGTVGLRATSQLGKVKRDLIVAGAPLARLVGVGDSAPGTSGTFSKLSDPAFADNDTFAFTGTVKGVAKSSDTGLWAAAVGQPLHRVALEGETAPGTGGALFSSIISFAATRAGEGPVFVAKIKSSPTSRVTSKDDLALFTETGGITELLLREGQPLTYALGTKVVSSFRCLDAVKGSPGEGRYARNSPGIHALVTFADKSTATFFFEPGEAPLPVVWSGGNDGTGRFYQSIGVGDPESQNGSAALSMGAKFFSGPGGVNKSNDTTIIAPGVPPIFFGTESGVLAGLASFSLKSFSDPVSGFHYGTPVISYLAKHGKPGLSGTSLFYVPSGSTTQAPGPRRIAGTGLRAYSGADLAQFKAVDSFATLDQTNRGLVFTAKLSGKGVSAKNNYALFAMRGDGSVGELLRVGSQLGGKTVKRITALGVVKGSPGQRRATIPGMIHVAALVQFTDRTESAITLRVPEVAGQ